jgi:hypothetical protein
VKEEFLKLLAAVGLMGWMILAIYGMVYIFDLINF